MSAPQPALARPAAGGGSAMVRMSVADGVAEVTLARAGMHNALVPELLLELCVALESAGRRDDVRAVLLLADGVAFSIGGDMRRFAARMAQPGIEAYSAELVGLLNQSMLTLLRLDQPVVAGVHGLVTGGSLGLVLACDVVIAADTMKLKAHYASAGFSPDGGWTALLPRIAGLRRAAAGLLLNATIDARQALDWGLVTRVVPRAQVRDDAAAAAKRIAQAPAATMRNAKRMLWGELDALEAALERERVRFIEAIGAEAARDGVARFLREFATYPDEPSA